MQKLSVVIAFVGMAILNSINSQFTIPYAIIAGAYIIGEAISNNKKR